MVFAALPEEYRRRVAKEKDLFNIGLQGPDILFYYHPLKSNPVSALGHSMHEESGRTFFEQALEAMDRAQTEHSEDAGSGIIYLYGVLCHFALDSTCHDYINAYEKEHGISHCDIEGELDRYLLELDGKDPLKEVLTKDFHPSRRSAQSIVPFFRGLPEKTIYSALRSFTWFHSVLYCPGDLKRNGLYGLLKLSGLYEGLRGHIISKNANGEGEESDREITRRMSEAVPLAVRLITEFPGHMNDSAYLKNYNGIQKGEENQWTL